MSKNNGFARVARRHSRHQSLGSYVCAWPEALGSSIQKNMCRRILPKIREVNKQQRLRLRLRLRQRQKALILLVKRNKMIVLHVRHAFLNISLPYSSKLLREMTKFEVLTTTWTNYSESFSLSLLQIRPYQSSCRTLRTYCIIQTKLNNPEILRITQTYILKWRFRPRSRRDFLNSLLASYLNCTAPAHSSC